MSIFILLTEEKISKLERELENANDLLAAARQRGTKLWKFYVIFFFSLTDKNKLLVHVI